MSNALRTDLLRAQPALQALMQAIFGADDEPVTAVLARAHGLLPQSTVMVWEADPLTFSFLYVSPEAEAILGYPVAQWKQKDFWTSQVVHPVDLADALSHCAMATAAGVDHDFEYRARSADGRVLQVHDIVHVMKGPLGFASRLRGVMIPVKALAALE